MARVAVASQSLTDLRPSELAGLAVDRLQTVCTDLQTAQAEDLAEMALEALAATILLCQKLAGRGL